MSAQRWVLKVPEENNGKTYWHNVGSMFANKSGDGFTIIIPPGVSVSGKVQALVPLTEEDYANRTRAKQGRPSRGDGPGANRPPGDNAPDADGNDYGDDDIPF